MRDALVDHIEPIAHGGVDHRSNLQAFCAGCNGTKGARKRTNAASFDIAAGGNPMNKSP